jgi:hypothetical protein
MVGVLLLLGILLIYIHTDSGKRFVKNKVESYLENISSKQTLKSVPWIIGCHNGSV